MNLIYNKMENLQNEYTKIQNEYTRAEERLDFVADEAIDITKRMLKDFFNKLTDEEKKKFYDNEAGVLFLPVFGFFDGVWIDEFDQLCCTYLDHGTNTQSVADLLSANNAMALMEAVKDSVQEYHQRRATKNDQ